MTSSTRRAMPWLVSAGVHLAAMAAVAVVLALSPPPAGPRVDISLVGGAGTGGDDRFARPGTRGAPVSTGMPLPARSSARSITPSAPQGRATAPFGPSATGNGTPGPSSPDAWPSNASRTTAFPESGIPSAGDVLRDTETVNGPTGALDTMGTPDGDAMAATGGAVGPVGGATEWGWQGLPRRLIRRTSPEFPSILSAQGQEVEAEARITVAPSGIVTRVEITRSSGYIEIDASVEAALRYYLFSQVDGRADSTGTVKFRFRLEKQD